MSEIGVTGVGAVQSARRVQRAAAAQEEQGPRIVQAAQSGQDAQAAQGQTGAEYQETPAQAVRQNDPLGLPQEDAPTLMERMIEAQKKAKEQRERYRIPKNTRYGDRAIEAYARLSRARRQADVSAAAGYARRQIAQLKTAKRQDPDNAERIQAAINQLQKAVVRAGKKKRDLDREQLTEARRRRLEQKDQLRDAQRLRQELRRRQALRMIRERGYIKEAEIDNRHQEQMAATRAEFRAQLESLAATTGDPAVQQQYLAQMAADGAAPMPAPELSVDIEA